MEPQSPINPQPPADTPLESSAPPIPPQVQVIAPAPGTPPPAAPEVPAPQPQPQVFAGGDASPSAAKHRKRKRAFLMLVTGIVIGVAAFLVLSGSLNKPAATVQDKSAAAAQASTDCTPPSAKTADLKTAKALYKTFTQAVADSDQACADALSSTFFIAQQKVAFATPDGKWIAARPGGLRPISEDYKQLPGTLSDASFLSAEYLRPIVADTNGNFTSDQPTTKGITIKYPVDLSKLIGKTSQKWYIFVGFVVENGSLLVDGQQIGPEGTSL